MVNKVTLLGRLGKDPESRSLQNGDVCSFSVATGEKYTDRDGNKQERTEWHRIVTYGKVAEVCQKYLSKGALVYIDGKIAYKNWEDKEGNKKYSTDVIAKSVQFIGGKKQDEYDQTPKNENPNEDDLPF